MRLFQLLFIILFSYFLISCSSTDKNKKTEIIKEKDIELQMIESYEKAIDAYPREYLELLQGKLDLNDPLLEENEYESTVLFGGSVLSFDSEGRVVLSDSLRNEINLASEALFVGMGRRFRIWDPKIFNEYLGRAKSYMDKRRKNKA